VTHLGLEIPAHAIEMMMPRFYMPILMRTFQEVSIKFSESIAYARIARKLRVPLKFVEYRIAYNAEFQDYYTQIELRNNKVCMSYKIKGSY
jgi:hypothetical protein